VKKAKKKKQVKDLIYEMLETSVSEFAKEAGLSRQTVVNVMSGKNPSLLTIVKICKYFGVDRNEYM